MLVLHVLPFVLRLEEIADGTTLGRDGFATDFGRGAFGYAVEDFCKTIFCVLTDLNAGKFS